jgi:hypothetical protein
MRASGRHWAPQSVSSCSTGGLPPYPSFHCCQTCSTPLPNSCPRSQTPFFLLAMLSELATNDAYGYVKSSRDSFAPGLNFAFALSSLVPWHWAAEILRMMCTKHFGFLAYRGQDACGCQPRNFWTVYCWTISQSREILINYSNIVISLSGLVLTQGPNQSSSPSITTSTSTSQTCLLYYNIS